MNRTNKSFYLLLIAILPFIYSCDDKSPEPVMESLYENGILVVNQGNFGQGNGSLDFYNTAKNTLTRNVYKKENEEVIGGIIQNVTLNADQMYIISNKNDKIIVADANSFQMINSVEGLTTPRYISIYGDKAYVSVWGPYTEDYTLEESEVVVLDLSDFSIEKKIPVAGGPEGIITIGNKIFVANSFSNLITVIDTETDEIVEEINTEFGPTHLLQDKNGKLWVSFSSGFLIAFNPEDYQEERHISIEGDAPQGRLELYENDLYFRTTQFLEYPETFNAIYKVGVNEADAVPQLLFEKENIYTFSIDPKNGDILAGIASGADPGTIVRFDNEGNELDNFAAGVFPHEIIFR